VARKKAVSGRSGRSLREFWRAQKAVNCKVCALPEAILAQIRGRDRRTASINVVVEWLVKEHGVRITRDEFLSHQRGQHHPGSTASRR